MTSIKRKPDRVFYYARNFALDLCPAVLFRRRLGALLERTFDYDRSYISWRVDYYNKLAGFHELPPSAHRIRDVPLAKSMYYYDLKEVARHFPTEFQLNYRFGDIRTVPDHPGFVKSRPIRGDNRNSVLLKLNKFRHFYLPADRLAFADKKPLAVWRGSPNNRSRIDLVRKFADNPLFDVGYTAEARSGERVEGSRKPFLHPREQMAFRYILSVEGNDVASNLKWILASNSLCLMPEPRFETWFMEGRLEAGKQYVRLRDDFADLEEKLLHYESHPGEALEIIANANRYVAPFLDERREQVISLLVMYKYFVASRQMDLDPRFAGIVWPEPGAESGESAAGPAAIAV
jgi:hypothetical protein